MKRIVKFMLLPLLVLSILTTTTAFANESPSIIVNNKKLPVNAIYKESIDKNTRVLVPLRAIFESLNAIVDYDYSTKTITVNQDGKTIILKINAKTASINGEKVTLDVPATILNSNTFVPARFISESLGAGVEWDNDNKVVIINLDILDYLDDKPLLINGEKVKALQHEFKMTMGGVVRQIENNSFNKSIYKLFMENKGNKVQAPADYFWHLHNRKPGAYYKQGQYDFLNLNDNSIQQFDVYGLITSSPDSAEDTTKDLYELLLHDVTTNQWHLFNDKAMQSINQEMVKAQRNGFIKIISDTVV